jgi:small GTP-binding protein
MPLESSSSGFVETDKQSSGDAAPLASSSSQSSITASSSSASPSKINLQIWDTAGQERCGMISTAFYRNAKGVVVVYDVTRRSSLLNVPRWVAHAKHYADPSCVFMVVGNKLDLTHVREVKEEEAEEICHILGVRHYYASALTGDGVLTIFFQLALAMNAVALTNSFSSANGSGTSDAAGANSSNGGSQVPKLKPFDESERGSPKGPQRNPNPDFSSSAGGGSGGSGTGGRSSVQPVTYADPYRIQLNKPAGQLGSDGEYVADQRDRKRSNTKCCQ